MIAEAAQNDLTANPGRGKPVLPDSAVGATGVERVGGLSPSYGLSPRDRRTGRPGGTVGRGMEIDQQRIAETGLVVLDVAAADEEIVRAVMEVLQRQWATSGITPVWRTPGEPGARTRVRADVRRPGTARLRGLNSATSRRSQRGSGPENRGPTAHHGVGPGSGVHPPPGSSGLPLDKVSDSVQLLSAPRPRGGTRWGWFPGFS